MRLSYTLCLALLLAMLALVGRLQFQKWTLVQRQSEAEYELTDLEERTRLWHKIVRMRMWIATLERRAEDSKFKH